MNSTYEELSIYVNSIVNSETTDIEVAAAIKKWKALLISTTKRLSTILKQPEEDVIADLLVSIVRMGTTYDSVQYRHNGSLYDLIDCDEENLRLVTPEFSKLANKKDFVIPEIDVEYVDKASLCSLVYHNIQQTAQLLLRNNFTQKNGYTVTGTETKLVKTRGNAFDAPYKRIEVKKLAKISEVSLDSPVNTDSSDMFCLGDIISTKDYNQEDYATASWLDKYLRKGLSQEAVKAYEALQESPQLSDRDLRRITGLTMRQVKYAKREVLLQLDKVLDKCEKSAYCPYALHKGECYYVGTDGIEVDDGTIYLNELDPAIKNGFYAYKSDVSIEYLKYRTPVHLRTSVI